MPDDDFPLRVRRARERLMLDRSDFARLLKVSEKTVQNWESGHSRPRNRMGALEQYLSEGVVYDPAAGSGGFLRAAQDDRPEKTTHLPDEVAQQIEDRVRNSGLFSGESLEKAIGLAKQSYIAEHLRDHEESPTASGQ